MINTLKHGRGVLFVASHALLKVQLLVPGNLIQCPPSLKFLVVFTPGTATSSSVRNSYSFWLCSPRDGKLTQCPPSYSCWLCSIWDGTLTQCPPSLQLLVVFTQGRQPHPVSSVLAVVGCVQSGTATSHSVRRPCSCWLCSPRDGNLTQCPPSLQLLVVFSLGRQPHTVSAVLAVAGCVHPGTATSPSVLRPCSCWLCSVWDGNLTQCPPSLQLLVVFTQGRQPHPVSTFHTCVGCVHPGTATSPNVRLNYICWLCSRHRLTQCP